MSIVTDLVGWPSHWTTPKPAQEASSYSPTANRLTGRNKSVHSLGAHEFTRICFFLRPLLDSQPALSQEPCPPPPPPCSNTSHTRVTQHSSTVVSFIGQHGRWASLTYLLGASNLSPGLLLVTSLPAGVRELCCAPAPRWFLMRPASSCPSLVLLQQGAQVCRRSLSSTDASPKMLQPLTASCGLLVYNAHL